MFPVALTILVAGTLVVVTDAGAGVLEAALVAFLLPAGAVVADAVVLVAGFAAVATVAALPEGIFVLVVVEVACPGDVTSALPALPVGNEIRTR